MRQPALRTRQPRHPQQDPQRQRIEPHRQPVGATVEQARPLQELPPQVGGGAAVQPAQAAGQIGHQQRRPAAGGVGALHHPKRLGREPAQQPQGRIGLGRRHIHLARLDRQHPLKRAVLRGIGPVFGIERLPQGLRQRRRRQTGGGVEQQGRGHEQREPRPRAARRRGLDRRGTRAPVQPRRGGIGGRLLRRGGLARRAGKAEQQAPRRGPGRRAGHGRRQCRRLGVRARGRLGPRLARGARGALLQGQHRRHRQKQRLRGRFAPAPRQQAQGGPQCLGGDQGGGATGGRRQARLLQEPQGVLQRRGFGRRPQQKRARKGGLRRHRPARHGIGGIAARGRGHRQPGQHLGTGEDQLGRGAFGRKMLQRREIGKGPALARPEARAEENVGRHVTGMVRPVLHLARPARQRSLQRGHDPLGQQAGKGRLIEPVAEIEPDAQAPQPHHALLRRDHGRRRARQRRRKILAHGPIEPRARGHGHRRSGDSGAAGRDAPEDEAVRPRHGHPRPGAGSARDDAARAHGSEPRTAGEDGQIGQLGLHLGDLRDGAAERGRKLCLVGLEEGRGRGDAFRRELVADRDIRHEVRDAQPFGRQHLGQAEAVGHQHAAEVVERAVEHRRPSVGGPSVRRLDHHLARLGGRLGGARPCQRADAGLQPVLNHRKRQHGAAVQRLEAGALGPGEDAPQHQQVVLGRRFGRHRQHLGRSRAEEGRQRVAGRRRHRKRGRKRAQQLDRDHVAGPAGPQPVRRMAATLRHAGPQAALLLGRARHQPRGHRLQIGRARPLATLVGIDHLAGQGPRPAAAPDPAGDVGHRQRLGQVDLIARPGDAIAGGQGQAVIPADHRNEARHHAPAVQKPPHPRQFPVVRPAVQRQILGPYHLPVEVERRHDPVLRLGQRLRLALHGATSPP
uniref:Uncharacterized protein n=1 Tax=Cereibacter sphaeroides (strain ATCC 17025 / ATH 2.4.3) TaxID=349102 RepID=A4X0N6_CERS5